MEKKANLDYLSVEVATNKGLNVKSVDKSKSNSGTQKNFLLSLRSFSG